MKPRTDTKPPQDRWSRLIEAMRLSKNPIERNSILLGRVAADGSPVLLDRSLLREHAHFLGSSGGGKTSMGLAPLIEQLISFGDSSVIVLDLKGDSHELLAAVNAARDRLLSTRGIEMPLQCFNLENSAATHAFTPLASPAWMELTELQRTDILSGALGLLYGSTYGRAFFTAANSAVIYAAGTLNGQKRNFPSLLEDIGTLVSGKAGNDLPMELRRSGVHAYEAVARLAAIKQLNEGHSDGVIDLGAYFREPRVLYAKLPSAISESTSGTVARLMAYFLLTTAHAISARHQIYLVIDEFQRMASESLNSLFELARSMDIALVLSNQSLEDLGRHGSSLLNVIETNCNLRQWFSVVGREDLSQIQILGGLRTADDVSKSIRQTVDGMQTAETVRQVQLPRISLNDALRVSNTPELSFMRINSCRVGYSRYRGLPFVVRNDFHITEEEFQRRKTSPWPSDLPGMITSEEILPPALTKKEKPAAVPYGSRFNGGVIDEIAIDEWSPN